MSRCSNPRQAWFGRELNQNGREHLVFHPDRADLSRPVPVACGKCEPCAEAKGAALSLRLVHDWQAHDSVGCFGTLTYAPESCPPRLVRDHAERFVKRADKFLRKRGARWRGCLVGEYGDRLGRPHYHFVLVGFNFCDLGERSGFSGRDADRYVCEALDSLWPYGITDVRPMNFGRALYVGNHCIKSFHDPEPIRIVSRRPALGGGWLAKYWEDLRKGFVTVDGRKLRIPPAYLAREEFRDELAEMRQRRRDFAAARPVESVHTDELRRESGRINVIARSKLARGKL